MSVVYVRATVHIWRSEDPGVGVSHRGCIKLYTSGMDGEPASLSPRQHRDVMEVFAFGKTIKSFYYNE